MQDAALADALDAAGGPASGPWGRRLHSLARAFAIAGGAGFLLLVLMSLELLRQFETDPSAFGQLH